MPFLASQVHSSGISRDTMPKIRLTINQVLCPQNTAGGLDNRENELAPFNSIVYNSIMYDILQQFLL